MENIHPEIVELIQSEIKHSMYFVEYPADVPTGMWKDGAGNYKYISDMGLDHLKASVHMVEREIKRLERSDRPEVVIDVLVPKAHAVLAQLKAEFNRKAHL